MKSLNRSMRQSGFFDFGMSLFILAVAGGVVWGTESSRLEQTATQQQEIVVEQTGQTAMAEFPGDEKVDTGSVLQ